MINRCGVDIHFVKYDDNLYVQMAKGYEVSRIGVKKVKTD
jgi:hypothetical protein